MKDRRTSTWTRRAPSKTRMYVWHPPSLADYTNGIVCAIADNLDEAIRLAGVARHPDVVDREAFCEELRGLKPLVIRRGAVFEYGGG